MDTLSFYEDQLIVCITNMFYKKKEAAKRLSEHLAVDGKAIFLFYLKNKIPVSGSMRDGTEFFFHGLSCSVKNSRENWSAELEFAPYGELKGFDKYSLCHELGFCVDDCDKLIDFLRAKKIVRLVDESLLSRLKQVIDSDEKISDEEYANITVADRYIFALAE